MKMNLIGRFCIKIRVLQLSILLNSLLFVVLGCPQCGGEDPALVNTESESSLPLSESDSLPSLEKESIPPSEKESDDGSSEKEGTRSKTDSLLLDQYKRYFVLHRSKQLDAVRSITMLENNQQRHQLVNIMLKQLFLVLSEAKQNLTNAGYLPGDPFPVDETVKESMSKVLENTAMFGDLVLFMPDIVHSMYDKEKEWQVLLAWCYGFSTQSGVFEGNFEQILKIMAQEVNIIPKEKNFINPFKSITKLQSMVENLKKQDPKEKTKKPKKKIERGPKLRKTEL
ncbi:unnamed protein product [Lymnaea stagnalis]|uniref:Coiled-coil domain-containing protein 134 n=1 Tax=Lymnaea stagnalis TaxID=6523 RepID=A0AAV2HY26_LYMST